MHTHTYKCVRTHIHAHSQFSWSETHEIPSPKVNLFHQAQVHCEQATLMFSTCLTQAVVHSGAVIGVCVQLKERWRVGGGGVLMCNKQCDTEPVD